jgi:transposase
MKKSRRKYDAEFKRQAVRMVTDDHKSCHAVEKSLGVSHGMLYRWVRQAKADPQFCFPGNGHIKPSIGDVGRLLKQNQQLRRERDILKKALGVFSRTDNRSTGS